MGSVEFFGESFELNETVSEFALMEFAEAAADGLDADAMQGMAAMMRLVKACVVEGDVKRFLVVARKNRASSKELIPVLESAFNPATERPTGLPSGSSDGQLATAPSSVASSDDRASVLLAGRPDLQLAVLHTRTG